MIETCKFRIKDSSCCAQLNQLARAANFVWNFCNQTQHYALWSNRKWPTALFAATLYIGTPLANAATTHIITGSAGAGGTLKTTSQTVISGKKAVFLVEWEAGYVVNTISGCDSVLTGMAYTTSTITAPCTVKATFSLAKKYTLTLKTDGDGSGTVSGAGSFIAGSNVQLTTRPANGSTFTGWRPSLCTDSICNAGQKLDVCCHVYPQSIHGSARNGGYPGPVLPNGKSIEVGSYKDWNPVFS